MSYINFIERDMVMRNINAVEFHKVLKANKLSALKPARIERSTDGDTEWWTLKDGTLVARQIGCFTCPSAYYVQN